MRRLTGLLLALSMFQLTTLDVRTECERHAPAGAQQPGPAQAMHAGHDMASMDHGTAPVEEGKASSAPTPKCCMVAGTCGSSAFASIVFADDVAASDDGLASSTRRSLPHSFTLAPEPPPPKA
jgi:hypothetical protein